MSKKTSLLILSILSMPMAANAVNPYYICQPCGKGQYENEGKCTACPKGQYQDAIAQTSCKKCSEGAVGCDPTTGAVTSCKLGYLYKNTLSESFSTSETDRKNNLESQGYTCRYLVESYSCSTVFMLWFGQKITIGGDEIDRMNNLVNQGYTCTPVDYYTCTKTVTPYCQECPAGYYCPDQNTQRICPLGHACQGRNSLPVRCLQNYCANKLGATSCNKIMDEYAVKFWYGWGWWYYNIPIQPNKSNIVGKIMGCGQGDTSYYISGSDPASGHPKDCDVYIRYHGYSPSLNITRDEYGNCRDRGCTASPVVEYVYNEDGSLATITRDPCICNFDDYRYYVTDVEYGPGPHIASEGEQVAILTNPKTCDVIAWGTDYYYFVDEGNVIETPELKKASVKDLFSDEELLYVHSSAMYNSAYSIGNCRNGVCFSHRKYENETYDDYVNRQNELRNDIVHNAPIDYWYNREKW